ncbi:glycosyltransferase [Clostridiaceae bacterium HSG29]|nr:glycosyltransferase [Clostridiaceae bacterium HSG29]
MKILMIIDSIDIGGAETYLVNLVEALKRHNYNSFVVSSGGIYEQVLIQEGIESYKLPVNSKNPLNLMKSIFNIVKYVKANEIDIIHAHGRMPAFIGNIVSKLVGVHFITTAHAKVEANSIYKYITTYGEFVISVSEDIKKHIVKEFNIAKNIIEIIPNGININKFKNSDKDNELIESLNLSKDVIRIMIVSRMDGELGQIAIDLVEKFNKIKSNAFLELIVVGDGDRFDELKSIANNDSIKILGKRSDIHKIINLSDIVVAVSRSALEAMASEKLVILAGGEGYLGFFDESKLEDAISDNFTGRNCNLKYSIDLLINDIEKAISKVGTQSAENLGKFSRNIILENYSLEETVIKTIRIYERVIGNLNDKE